MSEPSDQVPMKDATPSDPTRVEEFKLSSGSVMDKVKELVKKAMSAKSSLKRMLDVR